MESRSPRMWLEMSRDELHGGGAWGFTKALWAPTHKQGSASSWPYWEALREVVPGDRVLHLRGKGRHARFVGWSIAASQGQSTTLRPPDPGAWSHASSFYFVGLRD